MARPRWGAVLADAASCVAGRVDRDRPGWASTAKRVLILNPMRQGQSKRIRGRSRGGGGGSGSGSGSGGGKGPNPLTRSYESNGPDVKIRGTAGTIADKYVQLSRDALTAGDPVGAENYMQHAEHYYRLLAAAQAQFQPHQTFVRADADDFNDVDFDDEGGEQAEANGQPYGTNGAPQPQPQSGNQPHNPQQQGRQHNGGRPNGGYDQSRPRDDQRRPYDRNERRPYDRNDRQDAGGQDQNRQDFSRQDVNRQEPIRQEPIRQDVNRPDQNRQAGPQQDDRRDDRRPERTDRQPRGDRPARPVPDEQPVVGALPAFITGGAQPSAAQSAAAEAQPHPAEDEAPRGPVPAETAPEPSAEAAPAVDAAAGDEDGAGAARGGRRRRYGRHRSGAAAEDGAPAENPAHPDAPSD